MKWFTRFFLLLTFILISGNTCLEAHTLRVGTIALLPNQTEIIFLSHAQQQNLPFNIGYTSPYRLIQDLPGFTDETRDEEDEEPFSAKKSISRQSGYFVQLHCFSNLGGNSAVHKQRLYPDYHSSLISNRCILFQVFRI